MIFLDTEFSGRPITFFVSFFYTDSVRISDFFTDSVYNSYSVWISDFF